MKKAVSVGDALLCWIKCSGLAPGMNTHRIFEAWDQVSGAGPYTIKKFYRDGKLYITVSSSVIGSQLLFQKDILVEKINRILASDEMFIKDFPSVGYVKELIIK